MAKRRKNKAVDAPQTLSAAVAIADEYAKLEHADARADLICEEQIAEAKARRDEIKAQNKPKLAAAFEQLQAYFSANEAQLTGGKKRSVELGPLTIGERMSMPAVKLPTGMKVAEAVEWLRTLRGTGRGLVTVKYGLDKPALLKKLAAEKIGPFLRKKGFSISQKDEFFVKVGEPEGDTEDMSETSPAS